MDDPRVIKCGDCRWHEPIKVDKVIGKFPGDPILCHIHKHVGSSEQTCHLAERPGSSGGAIDRWTCNHCGEVIDVKCLPHTDNTSPVGAHLWSAHRSVKDSSQEGRWEHVDITPTGSSSYAIHK